MEFKLESDRIDWATLLKQKDLLLVISEDEDDERSTPVDRELVKGVVHLIEYIQDLASDQIGMESAYGRKFVNQGKRESLKK